MLKNYLSTAWRNLWKDRFYSSVNITGLSIGIAAAFFIIIYIKHHLNFDKFFSDSDQIYRISILSKEGDTERESYVFTPPIGPDLVSEFPEVTGYTRMSTPRIKYLKSGEVQHKIDQLRYADSTFFDFFSFRPVYGNLSKALNQPYSVVLTRRISQQIFNEQNPLGQIVRIEDTDYQITGVLEDPPESIHFEFDVLASFASLYKSGGKFMDWNGGNQYITYVRLDHDSDPSETQARFPDFMWKHINERYSEYGIELITHLQALQKIHLWYNPYSDKLRMNLIIFGIIALFILFIASVNFINLAIARSTRRGKEVGVRKVLGALQKNLKQQFIVESVLISFFASIPAIAMVILFQPVITRFTGQQVELNQAFSPITVMLFAMLLLIVGIVAGSYPAIYLSSLSPLEVFRKKFVSPRGKLSLKNILVGLQFAISIGLISSTLIIGEQLRYNRNKDLGFNEDQILAISLQTRESKSKTEVLKKRLGELPEVVAMTACSEIPVGGLTQNGYIPEGFTDSKMFHVIDVDPDFIETFDIPLKTGRNFIENMALDKDAYLVNESLIKSLNWNDAIGKKIERNGEHEIIGVINDFHFASLHHQIEPLIITLQPWDGLYNNIAVKYKTGSDVQTIQKIENVWKEINPGLPFEYRFLDDTYQALYTEEMNFQSAFQFFSFLAIAISLLGLLSLIAYTIERRRKEIGIRKILGANPVSVVIWLTGDVFKPLVVAMAMSIPLAWYAMSGWLENFAYRIELPFWTFGLASLIVWAITLITVGMLAWQAGKRNPVEAIQSE